MSGFVVRLLVMVGGRTREIVSVSRDRSPGGSVRALGRPADRPPPDGARPAAGVAGDDTAAAPNVRVAEPASVSRVPDPPPRAVPDVDMAGPAARLRSRSALPAALTRPEPAERPDEAVRPESPEVSAAAEAAGFAEVDFAVAVDDAVADAVDDRDAVPTPGRSASPRPDDAELAGAPRSDASDVAAEADLALAAAAGRGRGPAVERELGRALSGGSAPSDTESPASERPSPPSPPSPSPSRPEPPALRPGRWKKGCPAASEAASDASPAPDEPAADEPPLDEPDPAAGITTVSSLSPESAPWSAAAPEARRGRSPARSGPDPPAGEEPRWTADRAGRSS